MCSIVTQPTGTTGSRLGALVAHFSEVGAELCALLSDPSTASDVAGIPAGALTGLVTSLMSSGDAAMSAATVLTGHVDAGSGSATGTLVAGRYTCTRRFLEVEGGLSQRSAAAMVARARDLRGDYTDVAGPWLEGRLSSDAVREVTVGISTAIMRSGLRHEERRAARVTALDILLPVAEAGTVEDLRRAIAHLRLVTDPDGADQAALDGFDDQSLTVRRLGAMSQLTAWLTNEGAAAVMTVLTQRVDTMRRDGDLAPEDRVPPDVDPETFEGRRIAGSRYSHLLAIAFTDAFQGLLDDNKVGSHHGIAPHVTVTVDAARFEAGLGGDLTMPGTDTPVLLSNESVRRILCDADVTAVIVRPLTPADPDGRAAPFTDLLLAASREILYVGRTERVVPPRLRRALEVRDRHCQFPGCHAHVRRCHAHHVRQWENGGSTDIDNTVLVCVRHHHAIHEGGWGLRRAAGVPPGGSGFWEFTAPARRDRP